MPDTVVVNGTSPEDNFEKLHKLRVNKDGSINIKSV